MIKKTVYVLPFIAAALVVALALGNHRQGAKPAESRHILYYQDPMHPAYRSSKPGTAPDCGMALEPVYSSEGMGESLSRDSAPPPGVAEIDSATQQLYGIKLAKAEKGSGQGTVRVFARVEPDDTRVYRVNFGTDGFVKETHDDAVGEHVAKDQHLAVVYAPEFLSVAGGYLAANEHSQGVSSAAKENYASTQTQGAASVQARADRLRNLGMSDAQINEMSKNHTLPEDVYVVSPTDGFILTRSISSGMRFEKHADLYTVADLSHVWIVAEVLGRDARAFRPGATARVTLPDTDESFKATVSKVLPEVDPVTRSLKLRLEADNPGFKLRPNMFVNVELPVSLPNGITVPVDTVINSGQSKRVFVQTSAGRFEARTVETGWEMDQRVQILKGLQGGETVVSAGTFLVDSESRLQLTAKANHPADVHAGTDHRAN